MVFGLFSNFFPSPPNLDAMDGKYQNASDTFLFSMWAMCAWSMNMRSPRRTSISCCFYNCQTFVDQSNHLTRRHKVLKCSHYNLIFTGIFVVGRVGNLETHIWTRMLTHSLHVPEKDLRLLDVVQMACISCHYLFREVKHLFHLDNFSSTYSFDRIRNFEGTIHNMHWNIFGHPRIYKAWRPNAHLFCRNN